MLPRYDELELLDLIEDELDESAAAALRERLSSDPEAIALLGAMTRDRATLRSMPEPPMPHDLTARIEQALTRPMLIAAWGEDEAEPQPAMAVRPGEFRRRHTAAARRRRMMRYALAAGLGLMVLGGVWAAITALPIDRLRDDRSIIAQSEAHAPRDARLAQREATDEPWPPAGSIVHHYAPLPVLENHLAQSREAPRSRSATPSAAVPVEFALLVKVADPAKAEATIETLVASRGETAALVQNFSFEEAMRLEEQWLLAQRSTSQEPLRAGVGRDPQRLREVADRALDQIRERDRNAAAAPSRQLAGPHELAAPFAQQLEYSSRGATHTATMRLSELQAFLEEIESAAEAGALRAVLQPLPDSNFWEARPRDRRGREHDRVREVESWMTSRATIREAIAKLEATGDPLIHLPIVID